MSQLVMKQLSNLTLALCIGLILTAGVAVAEGPVAWWTFDSVAEGVVADRAADRDDRVEGNYKLIRGAVGNALLFDGFTTVIDRPAADAPRLSGDFSVEAWVAQGAYPWNWCPIVTQQRDEQAGYAFSVGPRGQIRLQVAVDGTWQSCTSEDWVLPLRKWIHIAGTFDAGKGITLYANGQNVGTLELKGQVTFAPDVDLRIGTNHTLMKPSNIHREHGTVASFWCLDGAIDELKIYNRALSPKDVAKTFADAAPVADCEIQPRRMPSGPKGPGRFGAVYCKLKYYEQWDALWRVDDHPDVLVRFDQTPVRVVFWRGSRYSPAWVTDKDQWMADQSVEAWKTGKADTDGCFEHMQDRLCRYSHVRIIESNDARTVVHWRYAPVSSKNNLWNVDEKTGRACWVDEYYTIYPDAIGVRKPTWKTGTLGGPHQFQESLPVHEPRPIQQRRGREGFLYGGQYAGRATDAALRRESREAERGRARGVDDPTLQLPFAVRSGDHLRAGEPHALRHRPRHSRLRAARGMQPLAGWPGPLRRPHGAGGRPPHAFPRVPHLLAAGPRKRGPLLVERHLRHDRLADGEADYPCQELELSAAA